MHTVPVFMQIDGQETMKENSDLNTKKTTQPFIQAAHRASVIVFSSRPLSDPSQDTSKSHGTAAPLQVCEDRPSSQNAEQNPSLDWTKPSKSKVFVAGNVLPTRTALSAMRLRHANLAEMFLDEECATYTSRLLSCPLQPRSGNPVATTLLFKDSTCFSPINLSSPLQPSPAPTSPSIRA
ncbi:hypothetical protein DNTS_033589 [Danionella cerebrum]|uniref:Uncharacterized protein n=1 Tax=Danionella cerebrum TaxID=2873325 RepID=A0A553RD28_9TELE|nr:hypothetical protein DNTS_033589 [Danionella translucida]